MQQICNVLVLATSSVLLSVGMAVAKLTERVPNSDSGSSFVTGAAIRNRIAPSIAQKQEEGELSSLSAKQNRPSAADNTYYLTMTLPNRPGKRFARLSFTENSRGNAARPIRFDLSSTKAFIGTPTALESAIAVDGTWVDETGTIWVEFKPSLAPKTTLTVAFKAQKLPSGNAREYGIAAYPDTNRPVAVFVGNEMLRSE